MRSARRRPTSSSGGRGRTALSTAPMPASAVRCSTRKISTRRGKRRFSSKAGESTTIQKGCMAHSAIGHQHLKPSSRWTRVQPQTINHIGAVRLDCSTPSFHFHLCSSASSCARDGECTQTPVLNKTCCAASCVPDERRGYSVDCPYGPRLNCSLLSSKHRIQGFRTCQFSGLKHVDLPPKLFEAVAIRSPKVWRLVLLIRS